MLYAAILKYGSSKKYTDRILLLILLQKLFPLSLSLEVVTVRWLLYTSVKTMVGRFENNRLRPVVCIGMVVFE